jgi:UDP-N-acetylmuramate dehydrogenase
MPILRDIELRELAYFKTGGGCDALNAPSDRKELAAIVKKLVKNKQPFFLLGGGSNSLVMDESFRGQVIVFKNFSNLERHENLFRVGAGITNTDFAEFACREGFNGAGWMNRLPGQIGGTVRMNARCYGGGNFSDR